MRIREHPTDDDDSGGDDDDGDDDDEPDTTSHAPDFDEAGFVLANLSQRTCTGEPAPTNPTQ